MPRILTSLVCGIVLMTCMWLAKDREAFSQAGRPGKAAGPDREQPPGENRVSITIDGDRRVIRSNGIPDHPTGRFPNRGNPNRIAAQDYSFSVAAKPVEADQPTRLGMYPFGVAVNGVPFDPAAAEWWQNDRRSGWQYEPLTGGINLGVDGSFAHVQPTGEYHYHGVPTGLIDKLKGRDKMTLIGWAADGFPIYGPWGVTDPKDAASPVKKMRSSYRVKMGSRPNGPGGKHDGSFVADWEFVAGTGDLDDCHGTIGATPEFPNGIYHYHVTDEFPFIPRQFRGTPHRSFFRGGPGGPGGAGPGSPPPGGGRPPSKKKKNS